MFVGKKVVVKESETSNENNKTNRNFKYELNWKWFPNELLINSIFTSVVKVEQNKTRRPTNYGAPHRHTHATPAFICNAVVFGS